MGSRDSKQQRCIREDTTQLVVVSHTGVEFTYIERSASCHVLLLGEESHKLGTKARTTRHGDGILWIQREKDCSKQRSSVVRVKVHVPVPLRRRIDFELLLQELDDMLLVRIPAPTRVVRVEREEPLIVHRERSAIVHYDAGNSVH